METLNNYIHNPLSLGRQSADELELLREKYPYFQALHILVAKCHKNQNTFGYNKNLKIASLYSGDRKVLFNFINFDGELSKTAAIDVLEEEKMALDEITINAPEEIIAEAESTIANEVLPLAQVEVPAKKTIFEVVVNTYKSTADEALQEEVKSTIPLNEVFEEKIIEASSGNEAIQMPKDIEEFEEFVDNEEQNISDLNPSSTVEIRASEDEEFIMLSEGIENTIDNEKAIPAEIEDFEAAILSQSDEVVEIHLNPASEDEELPKQNSLPEELDFDSWLDNFTLNPPTPLTIKSPQPVANFINTNSNLDEDSVEMTESDSISKPLEMDEELEELVAKDHPFVLAEMAYDIQAFVKIPEEKQEYLNEQSAHNPVGVDDLLDRFIHKNPKISRPKVEFYNPDNMARRSEELNVEIVSETLAALFYKQGHLHQSLGIYEKLILQNPDKKETFATRINLIKEELINRL